MISLYVEMIVIPTMDPEAKFIPALYMAHDMAHDY
jgi:hypothetical protein